MPRPAIHPGEILADELTELGVTPTELSRQINVPPNRVTQIIHGRRGITGDTALRLGHWFGTSAQFWLNLQSAYDIRVAEQKQGRKSRSFRPGPQVPLWSSRSSRRCCDHGTHNRVGLSMRLKTLTIERFKRIERVDFNLCGVNILIGGNNSGKSE